MPEDVAAIGRYLRDSARALHDALLSVDSEVKHLTSGGWTGTAADSFGHGWGECKDGGNAIIDALTAMAEKLGVSAKNYQNTDSANAANVSSLDLPPL